MGGNDSGSTTPIKVIQSFDASFIFQCPQRAPHQMLELKSYDVDEQVMLQRLQQDHLILTPRESAPAENDRISPIGHCMRTVRES